jgi:hypothetical protein
VTTNHYCNHLAATLKPGSNYKFYSSISAICQVYQASFVPYIPRNASWLSDSFKTAVEQMPWNFSVSNMDAFVKFAEQYGTHLSTEVTMGGKASHTTSFAKADYSSLSSEGTDMAAAAKISFGVFGGAETKDSAKSRSSDYSKFSSKNYEEHISCAGGSGACPKMQLPLAFTSAWVDEVTVNPVPITWSLAPIHSVFDAVFFPGDPFIAKKQSALSEFYVNHYCGTVQGCGPPLPGRYWLGAGKMGSTRKFMGLAAAGDTVFAVGGCNHHGCDTLLATTEGFDPKTNRWTPRASMGTARRSFGLALLGGRLFAVGGVNGAGHVVGTVESYNPGSNHWRPEISMPSARFGHAVGVMDTKLFVVGGLSPSYAPQSTVEVYDLDHQSWSQVAPMTQARGGLAVAVVGSKLYAIGSTSAEVYDAGTNSWTAIAPLPTALQGHAASAVGNVIYVTGGCTDSLCTGGPVSTTQAYDIASNTWTRTGSVTGPRSGHSSTVLENKLFVAGGENYAYSSLNNTGEQAVDPVVATVDYLTVDIGY